MPKISGQEIISETTDKSFRTLVFFSSATVLTKAYAVPLDDISFLGAKLPQSLLDVTLFVIVASLLYTYVLKWVGDLAAFRLWYNTSSIWSEFGTDMKLDKIFISGGVQLLKDLHRQKLLKECSYDQLPEDTKKEIESFVTNVDLYAVRLGAAGIRFATLSSFGHFYVWGQYFVFPIGLAAYAFYLLLRYGTFVFPSQI